MNDLVHDVADRELVRSVNLEIGRQGRPDHAVPEPVQAFQQIACIGPITKQRLVIGRPPLTRRSSLRGCSLPRRAVSSRVRGGQRPASSQSLLTVFQFLDVLTTPSRRSRKVPVNFVPA